MSAFDEATDDDHSLVRAAEARARSGHRSRPHDRRPWADRTRSRASSPPAHARARTASLAGPAACAAPPFGRARTLRIARRAELAARPRPRVAWSHPHVRRVPDAARVEARACPRPPLGARESRPPAAPPHDRQLPSAPRRAYAQLHARRARRQLLLSLRNTDTAARRSPLPPRRSDSWSFARILAPRVRVRLPRESRQPWRRRAPAVDARAASSDRGVAPRDLSQNQVIRAPAPPRDEPIGAETEFSAATARCTVAP